MSTGVQKYVEKYGDCLKDLAEAVTDAAVSGDGVAYIFIAESIGAIMKRGAQILDEELKRSGHAWAETAS